MPPVVQRSFSAGQCCLEPEIGTTVENLMGTHGSQKLLFLVGLKGTSQMLETAAVLSNDPRNNLEQDPAGNRVRPCFNRILLRGKEHQQWMQSGREQSGRVMPVFTSLGDGTSGMTSAASKNGKTWQADPCFFAVFQPSSINSLYLCETVPSINLLLCLNLKCRIHLFNLSPPLSLIKSSGAFFARVCPNGTGALLINSLDTSRSRKRSRRTNQRCPAEILKAFRTRLLSSCSLHPTQSREGPLICYHRYLRHQRLLCLSAAIVKMHLHMKVSIHFFSATRCKFNTGTGSFCPIWRVDGVFVQDNPALQISQWGIIPWTFVPIMRVQCLCITCQRSTHTFSQKIVVACFNL